MGWIANWLRLPDVRVRPRKGAQVDLLPLSKRGARWLKANLFRFPGAVWSRKRGCVELTEGDVIALHLVVERLGYEYGSMDACDVGRRVACLDNAGARDVLI